MSEHINDDRENGAARRRPPWWAWVGLGAVILALIVLSVPSLVGGDLLAGRATATATSTEAPTMTPTIPPTATATPLPPPIEQGGAWMVLVPAGKFVMGSESGDSDEKPEHPIYLDAFYIDQFEVTNALYALCVQAGVCNEPLFFDPDGKPQHPVTHVSWFDAQKYCEWRGARLPTEAEWEKAARGADGRTYPWGEGISCDLANYSGCVGSKTEVGSYPDGVSPFGAYDMAGNVWEWVADWYNWNYYENSPYENPLGPEGTSRVMRGGSWNFNENNARVASRFGNDTGNTSNGIGFRCVVSP